MLGTLLATEEPEMNKWLSHLRAFQARRGGKNDKQLLLTTLMS